MTLSASSCALAFEALKICLAGASGILQLSVTKVVGLTALLELAELVRGAGLLVMPHRPYVGPELLAILHFLAAREAPELMEI